MTPPENQLSESRNYALPLPVSGLQETPLKSILLSILAYLVFLSSLSVSASANNTSVASEHTIGGIRSSDEVQNTDNLNLRQSPTTMSQRLLTIPKDTRLVVRDFAGDWLKVSYDGQIGWVHRAYVRSTISLVDRIVEVVRPAMKWLPDETGEISPHIQLTKSTTFKYAGKSFTGDRFKKPIRQGTPLKVLVDKGDVLGVEVHQLSTVMEPRERFYVAAKDVRFLYSPDEVIEPSQTPIVRDKTFAVFRKFRRRLVTSSVEWTEYLEVVSETMDQSHSLLVRDFSGVSPLQQNQKGQWTLRREEVVDVDPSTMSALGLYNPIGPGPPPPPEGDVYSYTQNQTYVGWKIERFPWDIANNLPAPPGMIPGLPLSRLAALRGRLLVLAGVLGALMFFLLPDSMRRPPAAVLLILTLFILSVPTLRVGQYQDWHQSRYQQLVPYIEAQKEGRVIRPLVMPLGLKKSELRSYRWWFDIDQQARTLVRWLVLLWVPLTIPRLHYFLVPHPLEEVFRRILRGERPVSSAAEYSRSRDQWDSWKPAWWHNNQRRRLDALKERIAKERDRFRNILNRRRRDGSR